MLYWLYLKLRNYFEPKATARLGFGPVYAKKFDRRFSMSLILTVDQFTTASVAFYDRANNPVPVDGTPVWATSNPDVVTVESSEDGFSAKITTVQVGLAQVSVRADADLGEGVVEVVGLADIEVIPGRAVSARINIETAEEKDDVTEI